MNDAARRFQAALRSGEFKQCCEHLRINNCFCWSGVACEIYRRETHNGKWWYNNFELVNQYYLTDMPIQVRDYFGLKSIWGSCGTRSLVALNDDGISFPELADLMDTYEKELFI